MKIVETLQAQNQMILTLLQSSGGQVNQVVKDQVLEFLEEERERNSRKNNLIFFNFPECEPGKTAEAERTRDN